MLRKWTQARGNSATYECLARALQDPTVGRSDLAAKYCEICRDTSVGENCGFEKKKQSKTKQNRKLGGGGRGNLIISLIHPVEKQK